MTETTSPADLSIDRLDVIAPGAFAAAVAPLFEGARLFLGRLAMARPFGSAEELFARAREIAHAMPLDEKLELIDAHPRLGAPPADVSALSFVEQGYDRDATEREAEAAAAEAARARIGADHNDEIERALDAVIDIARDRYATLTAAAAEDPA